MAIKSSMNSSSTLIEKYLNSAYDNVKTVADSITDVINISEAVDTDAFNTNAANISSIITLANVDNIDKLGEDYQYVEIVANDLVGTHSSILEMGDISDTIDTSTYTEAGSYIKTVALSIADVNIVADSISNITTVAGDTSDINVIAADLSNQISNIIDCESIEEVVENTVISSSSIATVANNMTNINLIASSITSGITSSFTVDTTTLTFTNGILTNISN